MNEEELRAEYIRLREFIAETEPRIERAKERMRMIESALGVSRFDPPPSER